MKTQIIIWSICIIASCSPAEIKIKQEEMSKEDTGSLLFVGTYTDKEGHVNGQADGIYALRFDPTTASLSKTELKANTTNPSFLYVDAEKSRIYAVNEKVGPAEKIVAFSYNDEQLSKLNEFPAEGGAPCYITKVGKHILTANYGGGNHAVYSLDTDGKLMKNTQVWNYEGSGLTDRQGSPHAHMIIENPHTGQVLGTDLGTDKVSFFNFDDSEGQLSLDFELRLEPGSGPRHLDFHPSKDIIYVINELNGTIEVLTKVNGSYASIQNITSTKNPNNGDAGCAEIHIHPSGKYLFASNRGPFNSISQYKVAEDGSLELYAETSSMGQVPRAFTFDPSGKFLLVANQNSDNIAILMFDTESGQLINSGNEISVPTPVCLKFE